MSAEHPTVWATVRCWPEGRVIPGVEIEFFTIPLVDDVIEIVEYVAVIVRRRRFAPDGAMTLWCDPEPGSDYTFEMLRSAFDEVRDA
jgi:hypothetical protein